MKTEKCDTGLLRVNVKIDYPISSRRTYQGTILSSCQHSDSLKRRFYWAEMNPYTYLADLILNN